MSVPCGMSDGLPVGMMLIGRHYEESIIYRAAGAFEAAKAWRHFKSARTQWYKLRLLKGLATLLEITQGDFGRNTARIFQLCATKIRKF